jgi:hypothetical protein
VTQLTADGSDTIMNGTSDWVYEEELDVRDGFRWSPDGELADLDVPPQEWCAIVTVRPNVLVEGPDSSTEKVIRAARSP